MTTGRSREVAALLEAARAVLENRDFADASKAVLGACKTILGAEGGFVAVCAAAGEGFEVAFLDPGHLDLDSEGSLPAPLHRLGTRVSNLGQTVFANDLSTSAPELPDSGRRSVPQSALLAPIVIAGEVAGIVGLVDKPDGFAAIDSKLVEVFAEMAAVAMLNSRTVNGLEKNRSSLELEVLQGATKLRLAEEQFKTLVENLPDIVARFDPQLRHLYVSSAIERVTGRAAKQYLGRTNREVGVSPS